MLLVKLFLGLSLVLFGADILIRSAVAFGKKFKVSEIIIGIIVVGFGTSLCEFLVSIDAVLKNATNLSLGNIIGSNIANILLVLGLSAFVKSITTPKIKVFDYTFHFVVIFLFIVIFFSTIITNTIGIIFILIFIFYIFLILRINNNLEIDTTDIEKDFFSRKIFLKPYLFGLPIIFFSIILTVFGADLTVTSAIEISKILKISESIIGLTLIAIGTSLPEIAAGISAARRSRSNLIFGNIIGSNLYNLLAIIGFSSLFKNFSYEPLELRYDVIFMGISVIIFSIIIFLRKNIGKPLSVFLVTLYLAYLIFIYKSNF